MTNILIELRAARVERGLTQHDVAERIGTTQSAVARLEAAAVNPKLSTVEAYGAAVGRPLSAGRPDRITEAASAIAGRLADGDPDGALRVLVQLHDDLAGHVASPDLLREPPTTGARTWDAAIAAVIERAARTAGVPVPGWTAAPSRFLDGPWFPLADILGRPVPAGLACLALTASPPEFAARGVHLDPATFESC